MGIIMPQSCYIYATGMHNACLMLKKHALRLSVFSKKLNFVAGLYKKRTILLLIIYCLTKVLTT